MTGGSVTLAQVLAASPTWIYLALITGLALHIGGGGTAILAGYGAVSVTKDEARHRAFGKVFVIAMLVMAAAAVAMAAYLMNMKTRETTNFGAGAMAAYLVTTGYMAVKRPEMTVGSFEKFALAVVAAVAAVNFHWGLRASSLNGTYDGYQASLYYVMAGIATLAAALDVRMLQRGGVAGVSRISRHLWRMCVAFFVAAGSFFLGQQKVMPEWMHGSKILLILGLAPLGFMIFWLIRVRIGNRFKRAAATAWFEGNTT